MAALPAPTEREKTQMYLQRYIGRLPAAGEVVIFDRSWYNRALVERVMGFCTEEQARYFLRMCPEIEDAMVCSGIILVKYWFEVGQEEQTRRFMSRINDGRKIWKRGEHLSRRINTRKRNESGMRFHRCWELEEYPAEG